MLEFKVSHVCGGKYNQLNIGVDGCIMTSGLLDKEEAIAVVKDLIRAADELLPSDRSAESKALSEICNSL